MRKLYFSNRHGTLSNWRKLLCLAVLSIFAYSTAFAQLVAGNYSFTAASGTFTPLGASATTVPTIQADDEISASIPLGFTFAFEGVNYTDVKASSNGFLSFNASSSSVNSNNLSSSTSSSRPLVAPLWDDLDGRATGGSTASYLVTGTAGSRVFTFEWLNWEWRYNSNDPVISFQVKLYEGTNVIEFIYRQESGAVVATATNGASIGIAGAATGAGNYLSLNNTSANPTASSTTETTSINTKPANGQIYRFTPPVQSPADAGVTALVAPLNNSGCFGTNESVTVTLRNFGTSALTSIPVTVNVGGAATANLTGTFTGNLVPGASTDFTLPGSVNMTNAGTYNFTAFTNLASDGSRSNDTLRASRTVIAPLTPTLPTVTFTGFTGSNLSTVFPGWTEASGVTPAGTTSAWTNSNSSQETQLGSTTARINLYTTSRREWIIGPKFRVGNNTHLLFKAAVTDWNSGATAVMGSDDSVRVMISDDCGATFKTFRAITATNNLPNTLTQFDYDLSIIPAGTEVIVAFLATDGPVDDTEDYDFHIDDIEIKAVAANDAAVAALVNPLASGCYGSNEQVTVTIRNAGSTALTSVPVTVRVSGAGTANLTGTFTGSIAPGTSTDFTLPGSVNMSNGGVYNFVISTNLATDGDRTNDTLRVSRTVIAPLTPTLPTVTFNNFNGTNLSTVEPGWFEASGTNPTGTTSAWTNSATSQTTHFGSTTAKLNFVTSTTQRDEWIIGPKFTVGSTTALRFMAAVTSSGGTAAGLMGSADTVHVMLSNDCGLSFKKFYSISESNNLTNTLTQFNLDLSALAGAEVIVAFYGVNGNPRPATAYDFHLDNIQVKAVAPIDAGIVELVSPLTTGCYGATEQVTVTIRNA
ncbi:MAG: choice-of-anchor J domain-containing protein, partial [Hymenobacteraceae bacterium]|nr:choice-of-anchor J domain-containing protein [Hymenobacteraceae bacterium]MDX5396705.1 choice-of-anchor J domain-containing protein [Hymenobacteraceae bacterium]MDX5512765.1 choice-of-anchor J domain-containing protein [Hymenobacteraceae bacterium]